jgi:hypothetical protein
MVEYLPSKQATWVRFPSPALGTRVVQDKAIEAYSREAEARPSARERYIEEN